ncbi:MAG TPA: hypothetical protein DCZ94_10070 [Lentisphaeria bacterium]|nr:MAG: hypothetical protein A2X48_08480 [Lentisphaerae bacterium GWF2_49_21]HBC87290.1 hypothetical protein [Lentisphaeria bacterium]
MKPSFYKSKWNALKRKPDAIAIKHLANQVALSFLDRYFYNDRYEAEYIDLLCEMATCFEDDEFNKIASSALFGIVVEGLCDDFEDLQTETYNRVMSQVISFCRKIPSGREFNKCLHEFGLFDFNDLMKRVEKLRAESGTFRKLTRNPKKIMVLSRVTIGADVAITSVIIQRLMNRFLSAEIVLIGDARLSELFGNNSNIRIAPVVYSRRGGLIERFGAWHSVLEIVENETSGNIDSTLLIDPDSRLSQLGVLPLVDDSKYLFFNSRGSQKFPPKLSLSRLANLWMDKILGESEFCYPMVWLSDDVIEKSANFAKKLRKKGCRKIISVNFGVGGNSRKRVDDGFEEKLVLKLLAEPRTVVLLDRGFGTDENARSESILKEAAKKKIRIKDISFGSFNGAEISGGVIGIRSGIGEVASLIAESDEFIGYDSACQHIAAALGITAYTIFAGSNNPRFIRRWNACGPEKSEIIHVDTLSHPRTFDTEDIIARIIDERT